MKKIKRLFLSLAVAVFLLTGGGCQKEPVKLTVISTNDFHGQIESRSHYDLGSRTIGGFDWLLGYFKAVRDENPGGVILLDGGDLWQGTLLSNLTRGQAVIDLYNEAGYDAVAIGNHEFDFGPGESGSDDLRYVLKTRLKEAKFPMLGANVVTIENRKPLEMPNFKPYTIIERHGVKVGIIGLATPNTRQTTAPKHIYDLDFTDGAASALKYSQEVRDQGAQVVILLTHMGANWDSKSGQWEGEVVDLVKQLGDAVDLVIGAHTHTIISQTIAGVPVMSAGYYGRSFTQADIEVRPQLGRKAVVTTKLLGPTFFFHQSTSDAVPTYHGRVIEPVHSFDDKIANYIKQVKEVENRAYGVAIKDFTTTGHFEGTVGRLATDALLKAVPGADLALINRGSLRNNLPAGQVSYGQIYSIIPFDNDSVTIKIKGKDILTALNFGLKADNWALAIAGAQVFIKPVENSKDFQVTKVTFPDGSLLESEKTYTVVSNDFLYAKGDGFSSLSNGELNKLNIVVRDILADYIKLNSPIAPDTKDRYVVE